MGNYIMMEGVRSLYDNTMKSLKMEHLNVWIINFDGIFINIIDLTILVLSLKVFAFICAKLVDMTDNDIKI